MPPSADPWSDFGDWSGGANLPALLVGADQARSNPAETERVILAAIAEQPDEPDLHKAAYRFYFYNNRWADALPHADFLIIHAARHLNIATDWRLTEPRALAQYQDNAFASLYMQALVARGYCCLRVGDHATGIAILEQALALDPADRFHAGTLLGWIARAESDDEA